MKKAFALLLTLPIASFSLLSTSCDSTGSVTNAQSTLAQLQGYADDLLNTEDNTTSSTTTTADAPVFEKNVRLVREYEENSLTLNLTASDGTTYNTAYSHLPMGETFVINSDECYYEEISSVYALENDQLVLTTTTDTAYGDMTTFNDYVDEVVHKTAISSAGIKGMKTLHSANYVNNVYAATDAVSYRNNTSSVYYRAATEIQSIYDTFYDVCFSTDRSVYNKSEIETKGNEISFEFERWTGKTLQEEIEGELNTLTGELEFEYEYEEFDSQGNVITLIDYDVEIEQSARDYYIGYTTLNKDYTTVEM